MDRKRIRQIIVCDNCRKKKKKCDRNLPCSSCVKAKIDLTCTYSSPSFRVPQNAPSSSVTSTQAGGQFGSNGYPVATYGNQSIHSFIPNQQVYHHQVPNQTIPNPGLHNGPMIIQPFNDSQPGQATNDGQVESLKNKIKELEASISNAPLQGSQQILETFSPLGIEYIPSQNRKKDISKGSMLAPKELKLIGISQKENKDTNLIGVVPVVPENHTISFLSSRTIPSRNETRNQSFPYRPIQFLLLLRQDRGSKLFFNFQMKMKNFTWRQPASKVLGSKDDNHVTNGEPKKTDQQARDYYGLAYIDKIGTLESSIDLMNIKNAMSIFGLNLGMSFVDVDVNKETNLLNKINLVIPIVEVLDVLLKVFFRDLYPFFPLLDEDNFRSQVKRILVIDDDTRGKPFTAVIEKKKDLAIISTLLLVSRLTYLSVFSNVITENDEILNNTDDTIDSDKKFIMENPIPLDAVNVAEHCLREFDLTQNTNLLVLQAATFLKIYRGYAPEEGLGTTGGDFLIHSGILVQVAYSMSLNRDPDLFFDSVADQKNRHLRRKLWYFLIATDIEDSIIFGTPICTPEDDYDTKVPFHKENNSNVRDENTETKVTDAFQQFAPVNESIHRILEKILKVKAVPKVYQLNDELSELEKLIAEKLGTLSDYFNSSAEAMKFDFLKVSKLKLYLHCKVFLVYTYYILHLHYEAKGLTQLHLFYLKKTIEILFHELAGLSLNMILNHKRNFGPAFTLIISPILHVFTRIEIVVNLIVMIRLTCTLRLASNKPLQPKHKLSLSHKKSLETMLKLMKDLGGRSISMVSLIGNRYHFAWKSKKAFGYLFILLAENSIYEDNIQQTEEAVLKYSTGELDELVELLRSSIKIKDSPTYFGDHTNLSANKRSGGNLGDEKTSKLNLGINPSTRWLNELQLENLWLNMVSFRKENELSSFQKGFLYGIDSEDNSPYTYMNQNNISFNGYAFDENSLRDFEVMGGFSFSDLFPEMSQYNPYN